MGRKCTLLPPLAFSLSASSTYSSSLPSSLDSDTSAGPEGLSCSDSSDSSATAGLDGFGVDVLAAFDIDGLGGSTASRAAGPSHSTDESESSQCRSLSYTMI